MKRALTIRSPHDFVRIALEAEDAADRKAALIGVSNITVLAGIARNGEQNPSVRITAIRKLNDKAVLHAIIRDAHDYPSVRTEAVNRLAWIEFPDYMPVIMEILNGSVDIRFLRRLSGNGFSVEIMKAAEARLSDALKAAQAEYKKAQVAHEEVPAANAAEIGS
ncbi:MAG: hypothetical protein KGH72_03375 [Candidatus Micrarchaeota archaeon]|nr:hypothetical protein [Candidatus Micrarchaeota archaeon]